MALERGAGRRICFRSRRKRRSRRQKRNEAREEEGEEGEESRKREEEGRGGEASRLQEAVKVVWGLAGGQHPGPLGHSLWRGL